MTDTPIHDETKMAQANGEFEADIDATHQGEASTVTDTDERPETD